MNAPCLFIDDHTITGGNPAHIKIAVLGQLTHRLAPSALGLIGEEIHRVVAVGEKVECIAKPTGIGVVGIGMRHLFNRVCLQIENPNCRGLTAAVAFPGVKGLWQGRVGNAFAIWRISATRRRRDRQWRGEAACAGYRKKAGQPPRNRIACRGKEDRFAVGAPALHHI